MVWWPVADHCTQSRVGWAGDHWDGGQVHQEEQGQVRGHIHIMQGVIIVLNFY